MYTRICAGLEKISNGLLVALMLGIVLLTLAGVVTRYFLNSPLTGSDQFSRMMFVWTTFIGAATLYRRSAHIAVDYFVSKVPTVVRATARWASEVLLLGLFAILLVYGTMLVRDTSGQTTGALNISPSYLYAAAPVSAVLLLAYWIEKNIHPRIQIESDDPTDDVGLEAAASGRDADLPSKELPR